MKTYNFNICKYHVTITIEKKSYKTAEDELKSKIEAINLKFDEKCLKPVTVDEILEYCGAKKDPEEIKMEEKASDLCVLEAAEKYIQAKRGELADSTRKGYKNIVENHLSDIWLYRLDRLTEEHLQKAFDAEIAKGLSVKTLKGYRTFILKVLAEYRPDFHPNIRVTKEDVNETPKT